MVDKKIDVITNVLYLMFAALSSQVFDACLWEDDGN